jgi:delta8-fatty-acid desaturase
MDVVCSEDIEFVHGGLHLQVTHHLFPRMPRHNLRKASLLVKEYCNEQDIKYIEHGWLDGYVFTSPCPKTLIDTDSNRKVLGVLEDVANQLKFLKTVADAEIVEKLR